MKQLRDESQSMLHYIGVADININGTLEEVRKVLITQASFAAKERFVFVTKRMKLIHPKKEHGIVVKQVYQHSVQIKILHGNGKLILARTKSC